MKNASFTFQSLHPETIFDAVAEHGIIIDSGLTALNSYENRVWQFTDENRKRYVVKFYRPQRWTYDQIVEEHQFAFLLQDAGVPLVAPLRLQGKSLHRHQGFWFALFPAVSGRQYEADNEYQLEQVGRIIGRMHRAAMKETFQLRPSIGLREKVEISREILELTSLIPGALKAEFLRSFDRLSATLYACWHQNWLPRRLHGDCHAGNILWRDGPWLVDLDDACNGPAVQDLWLLINGNRHEQRIQWHILLEAYGEYSDFHMDELSLIEPLRAMRMMYYLAWIAHRWQDPAFPGNFSWMKEDSFWHKQITIFNEQDKLLQEPPLRLMPVV